MRILLVHNRYTQFGGEDTTYLGEKALLEANGQHVDALEFSNEEVQGAAGKLGLLWRAFYNPEAARRLREKVAGFKPDVIHVHNFFYVASAAIFIEARRLGVPVVATIQNYRLICNSAYLMREGKVCELCVNETFPLHGIKYACHRGSRLQSAHLTAVTGWHKAQGTFVNSINRFITVTEFNRNKLLNSSLRPAPGQVIAKPNSVADAGHSPVSGRTGGYLFVGRLSPEKGIETLLKAAEQGRFPLRILGGGPLEELVRGYAQRLPNVAYLGFQSRDFILAEMKQARALLFPSVWYEGLPLTILEAMSTGLPIIISNLGNLNEIVTHGIDGLTFEPGNAQALAQRVGEFEAQNLLSTLSQGARQTYLNRYTHEGNFIALMRIYEGVNGKRKMENGK